MQTDAVRGDTVVGLLTFPATRQLDSDSLVNELCQIECILLLRHTSV